MYKNVYAYLCGMHYKIMHINAYVYCKCIYVHKYFTAAGGVLSSLTQVTLEKWFFYHSMSIQLPSDCFTWYLNTDLTFGSQTLLTNSAYRGCYQNI